MLLFWKLVDETQISKPPEPNRHHNSINYESIYPSELFYFAYFNMRHPVKEKPSLNCIGFKIIVQTRRPEVIGVKVGLTNIGQYFSKPT
jgi:hypothetical protein